MKEKMHKTPFPPEKAPNNEYRVEYKRIILSNDDPGEIEKQLNKSKSRIREKYLGQYRTEK